MYYLTMEENLDRPIDMVRVAELMRAREIRSHAQLARRSGLDPSTLSRLFKANERQSGSADTLSALADALETTVDYLKGKTNDPRRSDAEPLPPYALEIVEMMKKLGHSQRYELLLIAKAFVEKSDERETNFLRDVNELFIQFAENSERGEEFSQYLKRKMDDLSEQKDKNDNDTDSSSEPA